MLFDSWTSIARVVVACTIGYAAIVVIVRAAGKRSLSKMNAFDIVINVALGSILATMTLSDRVPVANGLAALAMLVLLQTVLSYLTSRSALLRGVIKAEPALLFWRGEFQSDALQKERISREEITSAVRQRGASTLEVVEAVVLESTGDLSVVLRDDATMIDASARS